MGLIRNVANKFKFKKVTPIKFSNKLSVGEFDTGRVALLKKGKIVDDDLNWIAGEKLVETYCNEDYFLAEKIDGDYRVYDKNGEVVVASLKNPSEYDLIKVSKDEDDVYIVDLFDVAKVVVVPRLKMITNTFSFVDAANKDGVRLVTRFTLHNDGFEQSCYVDKNFREVSPRFVEEQDFGDFKILSVIKSKTETVDYICDSGFKRISNTHDFIDCVNGKLFATDNDDVCLIDMTGDVKTKALQDYKVLNNGFVVAMEEGRKTAKLIDNDYEIVGLINNPVIDEFSGIIAGEMAGRYVMFGYDDKKLYEVDKNIAELMIDKLQGKRMSSQTLSYVLDNEIDMTKTMNAYELIVAENYKVDPENEYLRELTLGAKEKFLQSIERVASDRVRRANEKLAEIEEEKRRMADRASKIQKKKGSASKFTPRPTELEEE